ncbi:MAG: hypothetical protein ACRD3G_30260, partial [Vicinamibacterales bacterium]
LKVVSPLDHVVKAADLIVRVQVDSVQQAYQPRVGEGYCGPITVFEATIRELVVNRRSQRLGPIRFVMPGSRVDFFSSGGDYIAFLGWHAGTSTYRTFWRSYLLPVRDGKANLPGRDLGEGDQPLDKVLAAVRALSGQR